jgi:hypothetical protein
MGNRGSRLDEFCYRGNGTSFHSVRYIMSVKCKYIISASDSSDCMELYKLFYLLT